MISFFKLVLCTFFLFCLKLIEQQPFRWAKYFKFLFLELFGSSGQVSQHTLNICPTNFQYSCKHLSDGVCPTKIAQQIFFGQETRRWNHFGSMKLFRLEKVIFCSVDCRDFFLCRVLRSSLLARGDSVVVFLNMD